MIHFADSSEVSHHQVLKNLIQNTIKNEGGVISFAHFMELALYAPNLGYYNTQAFNPIHRGDFITAPEISPLFAACFANTCSFLLAQFNANHIMEIGAGSGRFAADLLLYLEKREQFVTYIIYEISPLLRKQQQTHLLSVCPHLYNCIQWVEALPTNMRGIIIANEVLDALPTHCFSINENHAILERGVSYHQNEFIWQSYLPSSAELQQEVALLSNHYQLPAGYQSEINLAYDDFIRGLDKSLTQGIVLLVDYGYGQNEYYHPARRQGTLTCFYRHHYHDNPLLIPGLQDITSHVDFTRIIEIASTLGFELELYTHQSAFLLSAGLINMAEQYEKTLSPAEKLSLQQAIKILTFPTEMGERIKIMALSKNLSNPCLQKFIHSDRRRDL